MPDPRKKKISQFLKGIKFHDGRTNIIIVRLNFILVSVMQSFYGQILKKSRDVPPNRLSGKSHNPPLLTNQCLVYLSAKKLVKPRTLKIRISFGSEKFFPLCFGLRYAIV